jgi:hypothetical protein
MSEEWLKRLLMIPALVVIGTNMAFQQTRHALRRRLGDPSKRAECCGPRPASYPVNQKVSSIPDLAPLLERTSTVNGGYSPFFCCRVCGQEWYEDYEQLEFGGNIYVRKAP